MAADELNIDPWSSTQSTDYSRIIDQFGLSKMANLSLPNPSHLHRRGIIFAHRDLDVVLEAQKTGGQFGVLTGLMPSGRMHLGHSMVIEQVKWFQNLGGDVTIAVADLESQATRGVSLNKGRQIALSEYVANYAALGLDPNLTKVYFQSSRSDVQRLGFQLGKRTNLNEFEKAVENIGLPCVVKPLMSSSGKGQSIIRKKDEIEDAWEYAQQGGRAGKGKVIVEGLVNFDYEITQLTVRHAGGTSFCEPIGHLQVSGDYRESWQPQPMSEIAMLESKRYAKEITEALGGWGVFGVELFICGDEVLFSEVSPRPHDTGMVTMISQDLSQFALHVRAILGLPIPSIRQFGPAASSVILVEGNSQEISFGNLNQALAQKDVQIRLFGKPEVKGQRRMGVALARGDTTELAKEKAIKASSSVSISLG